MPTSLFDYRKLYYKCAIFILTSYFKFINLYSQNSNGKFSYTIIIIIIVRINFRKFKVEANVSNILPFSLKFQVVAN